MSEITLAELVDAVAARTHGTRGDPLARGEVEQIVEATLLELEAAGASDQLDVTDGEPGSSIAAMNDRQSETYRLPGVQDAAGTTGTLVFDVKPGGNVHADFEPDEQAAPVDPSQPAPDQSLPEPSESPAGEPGQPSPEQQPADPGEQVDEPGPARY